MDPLTVLRQYVIEGQLDKVVTAGDRVNFGDKYSFPKNSYTAFKSKQGGDYYQLESVLLFADQVASKENAAVGAYVRQCTENKIPVIKVTDRQALRDYLTGKVDAASLPNITDTIPDGLPPPEAGPVAKKPRLEELTEDEEMSALRILTSQERQLRDRNTMMLVPDASFHKVLLLLDDTCRRAQREARTQAKQPTLAKQPARPQQQQRPPQQRPPPPQPAPAGPAFMKPSGRLERDTTAEQLRALGGDAGLTKDLGLGYSVPQGPEPSAAAAAAPPQPPAAPKAAPPGPTARPTPAAAAAGGSRPEASARAGGAHKPSSGSRPGGSSSSSSKRKGCPIILVPSGVSALFNMFNARQFLQDAKFVRSEEARQENPSANREAMVAFSRSQLRQSNKTYHIMDKPPPRGHQDWKRVVAVIVQGKAWQFKDFPFRGADKGDLVDTFSKIMGAFFHYSDEQVPDVVAKWNVVQLPINRNNRHLDTTVVLDFYKALDNFLAHKKCELDY